MKKFVLCFVAVVVASCSTQPRFNSPHYRDGRFWNLDPNVGGKKSFLDLLKWQFTGARAEWPEFVEDNLKPAIVPAAETGKMKITYVNHATLLIQVGKINILTDPMFFQRTSPVSWAGPKRHRAPGIALDRLPPIHYVLISHNHYDHLDTKSVEELDKRFGPKFFIPLGMGAYIPVADPARVQEMDWWQSADVAEDLIVHFVPAQHWSARTPFDANESFWGGFVLQGARNRIYFAGDTGYANHFNLIREKFGPMDVSMVPIGAYEPRWFMKEAHINPEEAVLAHKDLEAALTIGVHFGTFQLTDEGIDTPVIELKDALARHGVSESNFVAPRNGQEFAIDFN